MTQYLIAVHHPDDYDPSVVEDEAMHREIDALNEEMIAAGVRIFAGGLQPASSARSLRAKPNGEVLITDGPYLESKEHMGGFGYWRPQTSTRRWRGGARLPSPVGYQSRCARFADGGPADCPLNRMAGGHARPRHLFRLFVSVLNQRHCR